MASIAGATIRRLGFPQKVAGAQSRLPHG